MSCEGGCQREQKGIHSAFYAEGRHGTGDSARDMERVFCGTAGFESRRRNMAPLARHPVPAAVRRRRRDGRRRALEEWGNARLDWLRQFVLLENGIPSHDTLGCVFAALDSAV